MEKYQKNLLKTMLHKILLIKRLFLLFQIKNTKNKSVDKNHKKNCKVL